VISLSVTALLAVALAGPLSALCIIGFWIAHCFFVTWTLESAPVQNMNDAQLRDVMNDWTKRGFNQYTTSHLARTFRNGDEVKIQQAIRRVVEIYDEVIRRYEKLNIDVNDYKSERDRLKKQLSTKREKP
jgi:hypothetical protein